MAGLSDVAVTRLKAAAEQRLHVSTRADQNAVILAFDSVRYPADRFIYFDNNRGESPQDDPAKPIHSNDAKG